MLTRLFNHRLTGYSIAWIGSILVHLSLFGMFFSVSLDLPDTSILFERMERPVPVSIEFDDSAPRKKHQEKSIPSEEESEPVSVRLIEETVRPAMASIRPLPGTQSEAQPQTRSDGKGTDQASGPPFASSRPPENSVPGAGAAPISPQKIVILIDGSLSMGLHDAFAEARDEALRRLLHMPVGTLFQVVVFNRTRKALAGSGQDYLVPLEAGVFRVVRQRLQEMNPQGSADPMGAMRQALAWKPDRILLMTDSDDLSANDIRQLSAWNAAKTSIDVLDFSWNGQKSDSNPLRILAQMNRGSFQKAVMRKS